GFGAKVPHRPVENGASSAHLRTGNAHVRIGLKLWRRRPVTTNEDDDPLANGLFVCGYRICPDAHPAIRAVVGEHAALDLTTDLLFQRQLPAGRHGGAIVRMKTGETMDA